tara:strand:+ start:714 stop:1949 length:1236 start_codon:yes stop_codon:yes gene_type:complete
MAKSKKQEPIVDNETGSLKVKEQSTKQPDGNETKGNVTKVKEKMNKKSQVIEETITTVDLSKPLKPEKDETENNNADDSGVVTSVENADTTQEQEEVQPEAQAQETPVLEDITDEVAEVADIAIDAIAESEATGNPLPENVQKLVDFIEETGGDINDYVKLNQDYSKMDNQDLLHEFYKQTKPHLDNEEINFLMEDQFSFDEDTDEDRDIKRKKLALKEQVASAKSHLDGQKSKYYEEIKGGSKLTNEQQEAINFYQEAQQQGKQQEDVTNKFLNKTSRFFGDKFKGFEYNVGDKKFRVNVGDAQKVEKSQRDINNFITKFVDKDMNMTDPSGYHKGLYTAMNPDIIANHFYEQGKADALKTSVEEAKNINMSPRQTMEPNLNIGGLKVRALDAESASDFKFKIKNNKFKN